MKKFKLFALVSLICFHGLYQSNAQTNEKYVKMGDITIGCNIDTTVNILKEKGCEQIDFATEESGNKSYTLKGQFEYYKDCILGIYSNQSLNVIGVVIGFPYNYSWETLSNSYFKLKKEISQKYDKPFISNETFKNNPISNKEKLNSIKTGECSYMSIYISGKDMLVLYIGYSEEFGNRVMLLYTTNDVLQEILSASSSDTSSYMPPEHLRFKDIPMDGPVKDFVQKLKEKGYKQTIEKNVLTGDFAGYSDCRIMVISTQNTDLVRRIGVIFPERYNWKMLYNNYSNIKNMLIQKYGKPTECIEEFESTSQPIDDQMKIYYVESNLCHYETVFQTEAGVIFLSIQESCLVRLIYDDFINSCVNNEEAINDL